MAADIIRFPQASSGGPMEKQRSHSFAIPLYCLGVTGFLLSWMVFCLYQLELEFPRELSTSRGACCQALLTQTPKAESATRCHLRGFKPENARCGMIGLRLGRPSDLLIVPFPRQISDTRLRPHACNNTWGDCRPSVVAVGVDRYQQIICVLQCRPVPSVYTSISGK
jgi:hypothetical protein